MKQYKVYFKHSKTKGGYSHRYTDWTLAEGGTIDEAIEDAKRWIRENRYQKGYKNRVTILEIKEIK